MKPPVLLVVAFKTPQRDLERLHTQSTRLGFDCYSEDVYGRNKGYAEAVNMLIQKYATDRELLFIANPDIDLTGLLRTSVLEGAEHFDVFGYALKQHGQVYYGGTLDPWRMSGGLNIQKPKARFASCDFVSGSLMGMKKTVIETIGEFDESYFMYYEDVDFCVRARKAGFRVGIDSESSYEHFESSDENPQKERWLARNRMKFLWKHGSLKQKVYECLRLPKTLLEDGKNLI